MSKFLRQLYQRAARNKSKVLFPEIEDLRVLHSLKVILAKKICTPVIPLSKENFILLAKKYRLKFPLRKLIFIDPENKTVLEKLAKKIQTIRLKDNLSHSAAMDLLKSRHYFSAAALATGMSDGVVTGSSSSTAESILPALKLLKKNSGEKSASATFIMLLKQKILFFADCSINIDPEASQLAQIAINTAELAQNLGQKPKIAMLSYSTDGSGQGQSVKKVREATKIAKKLDSKLLIEGELQADAALIPIVSHLKSPDSAIEGQANVLIFPDLNSANIAYKLVERLAGAKALGAVVTGLNKPYNDLSRGCNIEDIINLAAITAIQKK